MKHLNKISLTIIICCVFYIIGCKKEPKQVKYVAKVNETYLTESQLNAILDSNKIHNLTKNEIIRNWVTDELLFQEANKEGILKENEYKNLISNSERKIAGSLLLKRVLAEVKLNITDDKLENFYFAHKNDFKLFTDATLLNRISFSEEDKAILFRNTAIKSGWDKAYHVFINDSILINNRTNLLLNDYQIQPLLLLRIIKGLNKNEVSLVLHYTEKNYEVIQLIERYNKGTIPPFPLIKEEVTEMYFAQKQQSFIKNYLDNLRLNNDIEIIN
ncbi:MAG: hypothetical protein CO128_03865 [Ignavibacteriales bacterium CG_4_9_14_3_um_filter_30_11]|nr:MAG: hypothetical protein COW08_05660 [Ignavibacteriales bacterium CG12_big_fil_rev_8_21_14_0_65_30_8]PJA99334.1 MAG: hypothetical protein CO128_03865 [Ignavibacteriales bacterium CG_4_9_14_3_um_filter_30_11]